MVLKLTIEVPCVALFVGILHRATQQCSLVEAQKVIEASCGNSYNIYRGGRHIAIHEHSAIGDGAFGPRVAMIQE